MGQPLAASCALILRFSAALNATYIVAGLIDSSAEKLSWLGKLDSGSLKQKVAASIVAISSIHLLKVFMNVEKIDNNEKIMRYVIIHLTFVVSAIGMAWVDRMNKHAAA